MKCETIVDQIPLYLYGELASEEEEHFEQHVDACAGCGTELGRLRTLRSLLDRRAIEPPPPLLAECRRELMCAVEKSDAPEGHWHSFREPFRSFMAPILGLRQLAAAAALVVLGFLAARFTPRANFLPGTSLGMATPPAGVAGFSPEMVSGIRSVQPDPSSGQVRIALDETYSKVVTGSPDSSEIQQLLVRASRDQGNPGLRVESIEILKDHSASASVRRALLHALTRDPNPGVRLKALEGLKHLPSSDLEVRQALTRALLSDQNPAVRIQVIEVLTEDSDEALVGVLQGLIQKEQNNYVRIRCRDALRQMNASVGAF